MQLTIDNALLIIFIVVIVVIVVIADSKMMIVMNANAAVSHVAVNNIVSIVVV